MYSTHLDSVDKNKDLQAWIEFYTKSRFLFKYLVNEQKTPDRRLYPNTYRQMILEGV